MKTANVVCVYVVVVGEAVAARCIPSQPPALHRHLHSSSQSLSGECYPSLAQQSLMWQVLAVNLGRSRGGYFVVYLAVHHTRTLGVLDEVRAAVRR